MAQEVTYSSTLAPIAEIKENHDRIMHIVQQCDRQCRAGSVNRAQRAIEEAAIHQPAFHDGHQNRFVDPADETVQYEPKEEMLQR